MQGLSTDHLLLRRAIYACRALHIGMKTLVHSLTRPKPTKQPSDSRELIDRSLLSHVLHPSIERALTTRFGLSQSYCPRLPQNQHLDNLIVDEKVTMALTSILIHSLAITRALEVPVTTVLLIRYALMGVTVDHEMVYDKID